MSQVIEEQYDQILEEINNKIPKVDPELVMQAMYYERKFTDVEPQADLHIQYREGIDLDQKKNILSAKYGFMIGKEPHNTLRAVGLMTLGTIYNISADKDIEDISGAVTCASY